MSLYVSIYNIVTFHMVPLNELVYQYCIREVPGLNLSYVSGK